MSRRKTTTGVELKECFACQLKYPITYMQTLRFDIKDMNFCHNCMPSKKKSIIGAKVLKERTKPKYLDIEIYKPDLLDPNGANMLSPAKPLDPKGIQKDRRRSCLVKENSFSIPIDMNKSLLSANKSPRNPSALSSRRKRINSINMRTNAIKCDTATREEIINSFRKVKDIKLPFIKDCQKVEETKINDNNEINKDLDDFKIQSKLLKSHKSVCEEQIGFNPKIMLNNQTIIDSISKKMKDETDLQNESFQSDLSPVNKNSKCRLDIQPNKNKWRIKKLPKRKCVEVSKTLSLNKSNILSLSKYVEIGSNEDLDQSKINEGLLPKNISESSKKIDNTEDDGKAINTLNVTMPHSISISNFKPSMVENFKTFCNNKESRNKKLMINQKSVNEIGNGIRLSTELIQDGSNSTKNISKSRISNIIKLRNLIKQRSQASICNLTEKSICEEKSKSDQHEYFSESSIEDKHSDNLEDISPEKKLSLKRDDAKSDSSNHSNKFIKNPKFNSQNSNSTASSLNSDKDFAGYVQNVIKSCDKYKNYDICKNKPEELKQKVDKLKEHLYDHLELFKLTQNALTQLNNQKEAELSSISRVFEKIRQEIDSKERLIKIQLPYLTLSSPPKRPTFSQISEGRDNCDFLYIYFCNFLPK